VFIRLPGAIIHRPETSERARKTMLFAPRRLGETSSVDQMEKDHFHAGSLSLSIALDTSSCR